MVSRYLQRKLAEIGGYRKSVALGIAHRYLFPEEITSSVFYFLSDYLISLFPAIGMLIRVQAGLDNNEDESLQVMENEIRQLPVKLELKMERV